MKSVNSSVRVIAVVPARMASSRFPGKPLTPILGLPMVEHVRRRAEMAAQVDDVVVATCDREIVQAVEQWGGVAVMTSDAHTRCTDRVAEAMIGRPGDIAIIVQGDEPLLRPDALDQVVAPLLADETLPCSNLLSPLASDADLDNPDIVKAVCNRAGRIMFLTRARVPYFRERVECPVFRQTGIIAFRTTFLREYSMMEETPLERAEAVDMLRVLEYGFPIAGVVTEYSTVGVDRPGDVDIVERQLGDDPLQRALLARLMREEPV
jgi:3-deoxy-manno-octulosonate cytidylyltransferase (CMP-KDO synthetase)